MWPHRVDGFERFLLVRRRLRCVVNYLVVIRLWSGDGGGGLARSSAALSLLLGALRDGGRHARRSRLEGASARVADRFRLHLGCSRVDSAYQECSASHGAQAAPQAGARGLDARVVRRRIPPDPIQRRLRVRPILGKACRRRHARLLRALCSHQRSWSASSFEVTSVMGFVGIVSARRKRRECNRQLLGRNPNGTFNGRATSNRTPTLTTARPQLNPSSTTKKQEARPRPSR